MQQWNFMERRKLPRYEIALSCDQIDLNTRVALHSVTKDICEQGVGFVSPIKPLLDMPVDVCLEMPDNQEKIHVQGKVIWVSQINPNQYRAGICLDRFELRPIPLVLRMIKVQLKSRYYQ